MLADYLDKARARTKTRSDYALAKSLKKSESAVNNWRTGKTSVDYDSAMAIAELADVPVGEVLAAAGFDKAKTPEQKEKWKRELKRYANIAASVLLSALAAVVMIGGATESQAKTENSDSGTMPRHGIEIKTSTNYTQWPRVKRLVNALTQCLRRAARFAPGRGPVLAQKTFC